MKPNKTWYIVGMVASMFASIGCQTSSYAERGALLGGVTGTAMGAAIGENAGNPLLGAIAGTAAGLAVGSAVGDGIDRDFAHAQASAVQSVPPPGAVSVQQIVMMSSNGLGPEVIANHVRTNGLVAPLTPDDLIYLKTNGVSDQVIAGLQNAGVAARQLAPQPVATPIVVEEYHYGAPYWHHPHWRHGHFGHGHPGHARFGFSYSSHH